MISPKLTLKDFQNDTRLYKHYLKMSKVMRALDTGEPLPGAKITLIDASTSSTEKLRQMNSNNDFVVSENNIIT